MVIKMHERWAIYIDIEGFKVLYNEESNILVALCDLMEGIFLIGSECFPDTPDRIFAHQTGDGFVIVGEFGSDSLSIPVSIAVALLRHISAHGRFAKAAIGEGDFADISGCYPEAIRNACRHGVVRMGGGTMRLFSGMGTAFINAFEVMKNSPSGASLSISMTNISRIPPGIKLVEHPTEGVATIDWVNFDWHDLATLQKRAKLNQPTAKEIEKAFNKYILEHKVPPKWEDGSRKAMGLGEGDEI